MSALKWSHIMEYQDKRRRMATFFSILLIFVAAALGILFLVRIMLSRQSKIQETRDQITALLSELDPVARLQVAHYVVDQELDRV